MEGEGFPILDMKVLAQIPPQAMEQLEVGGATCVQTRSKHGCAGPRGQSRSCPGRARNELGKNKGTEKLSLMGIETKSKY